MAGSCDILSTRGYAFNFNSVENICFDRQQYYLQRERADKHGSSKRFDFVLVKILAQQTPYRKSGRVNVLFRMKIRRSGVTKYALNEDSANV